MKNRIMCQPNAVFFPLRQFPGLPPKMLRDLGFFRKPETFFLRHRSSDLFRKRRSFPLRIPVVISEAAFECTVMASPLFVHAWPSCRNRAPIASCFSVSRTRWHGPHFYLVVVRDLPPKRDREVFIVFAPQVQRISPFGTKFPTLVFFLPI